ncbi:MAG: lytic transglycosylase domain-containing protein [Candidatus Competibacteraceae bacterium]|nr:MAG: lytic transglycosylase domain-containing protein [Candidatus Competibacteraceae bacterium]
MKRLLLAGLVPVALALAGPAQADIYAFVDSNGVRHLSNVPNDPRYKLVMRTPAYSKKAAQSSSFAPSNLYSPGGKQIPQRTGRASRARLSRTGENNRQRFTPDVNRIAAKYRLDPALLHAVISAESSYNPWAVSPKGAMGLMQLMPGTAERFGVNNAYDPVANMHGGARYLRWLLDHFNDTRLAVAAYNAGEGAVQKYGNQIPPYKETQTYVDRVLSFYQKYRADGLYYTGASSGSLALNNASGYYPGRTGGVTIITPRTSRTARTPQTTYLRPTGRQVVVGNSSMGRPTITSSNSLFAGNDR